MLASGQVMLLVCPDCDLLMNRYRQVPATEHWTEWQCWDCGHVFGGFSDRGTLDLGLVREDPPGENNLIVFTENFEAVADSAPKPDTEPQT
jgi:hypothetical protein